MHTGQTHGSLTTSNWADETPEVDMELTIVDHSTADKEWPILKTTYVKQTSVTELRKLFAPLHDGNDKTTIISEELAEHGEESTTQEEKGAEEIRKRMRLEKGGEGVHERKRSRSRHATNTKEKL
jgi:hypothetical protein